MNRYNDEKNKENEKNVEKRERKNTEEKNEETEGWTLSTESEDEHAHVQQHKANDRTGEERNWYSRTKIRAQKPRQQK